MAFVEWKRKSTGTRTEPGEWVKVGIVRGGADENHKNRHSLVVSFSAELLVGTDHTALQAVRVEYELLKDGSVLATLPGGMEVGGLAGS